MNSNTMIVMRMAMTPSLNASSLPFSMGAMVAMRAKGVQVNQVKDLRVFQQRAQPIYKFIEDKVGKDLYDRVIAAAKATATK